MMEETNISSGFVYKGLCYNKREPFVRALVKHVTSRASVIGSNPFGCSKRGFIFLCLKMSYLNSFVTFCHNTPQMFLFLYNNGTRLAHLT